jgi:cobalt-zinc-cadmium resistance protein CzcA
MPIEAGDMMVILSPKSEWKKAGGREELVAEMQKSLSIIPNATFSFQQPIQMRFNELLTGAKQDVVIKIYGEDLNILSDLANNVGNKIKSVKGVEDLYVEEVTGLPQINIQMNRDKISEYGMNVEDINNAIETAFAGTSAGLVYEGERRFDLVVRLDKNYRTDIKDVQNLYVSTPEGNQIPLSQVANVSFEPGPVQIQRDNAKRRIIVGFNVRDRDVQSIIEDIKQIMTSKVKMPTGYYVTYGGQFQNLQEANQRLMIALPVALLLILVLLYFTFGSIKQSLLIFTAIPLSAIGGVFALLIRDLPFSISAGIGFIALFGVAVLNGIVLVAEFNRLDKEGVTDIYERVIKGTRVRLRPVLMTATVAALGFLPMALSSSSGAEVQRPLATVVIGGLITATALTLLVLPVLYIYFTDRKARFNFGTKKIVTTIIMIGGLFIPTMQLQAQEKNQEQEREITLEQAIDIALQNNNRIKIAQYEIQVEEAGKRGAVTIPRTEFSYSLGEFNTPNIKDNQFAVLQSINFPTVYTSQYKLAKARITSSEHLKAIEENNLISDVKAAYLRYVFLTENKQLLQRQDSLYGNLNRSSSLRYKSGESTKLESVTSATQSMQIKNKLQENEADMRIAKKQLQIILNTNDAISIVDSKLVRHELNIDIENPSVEQSPLYNYIKQQLEVRKQETNTEKNKVLPDIMFSYNSQTFKSGITNQNFSDKNRFSFFQLGIAIPIFPGGHHSKIQVAKIEEKIAQSQIELNKTQLEGELQNLLQEYYKLQGTLNYYQNEALPQAELIIDNSEKSFKSGDVSYTQYLQNLTLANSIQTEYLNTLYQYNQSIIVIEALLGL